MCFSASASFATAMLTATAGTAAIRHASLHEMPLAGIAFLFAAQQGSEGLLWLALSHPALQVWRPLLADFFSLSALVLWPVLVPLAIGLVERTRSRRALISIFATAGLAVGGYSALDLLHHPYSVSLVAGRICYTSQGSFPLTATAAYVAATCLSPLISSHLVLRLFGFVVAAGMAIAYAFYNQAFISVWCFFAAVSSVTIFGFFRERSRVSAFMLPRMHER